MSSASTPTILMKLYQGLCCLTHRGIPELRGSWLKAAWRIGDAVWGGIARGLFGCRASGVGPAVEERQPEPTAVVAGGDRRRDGSLRSGEDRRNGPPDAAGLGSSLQWGRVWRASSTTGRRVPSLVFRRSNWLSSRGSSRPARIVRRTGSSCWRRLDLKRVIAERFGVAFHERYVGKLLKKLGFSPMSARPRHAQNERVVEAFKTYGPPRLREIIGERR